MYDPVAHRFAGRDPARSGRNWYGYVSNNPATKKDPTGYAELVSDGEDPYYRASALGGVDEPYVPKPYVKPKPVVVVEEVDHGEVVQTEAAAPEPLVEDQIVRPKFMTEVEILRALIEQQQRYKNFDEMQEAHEYANFLRERLKYSRLHIEKIGVEYGQPSLFQKILCDDAYKYGSSEQELHLALANAEKALKAEDDGQFVTDVGYYVVVGGVVYAGVVAVAMTVEEALAAKIAAATAEAANVAASKANEASKVAEKISIANSSDINKLNHIFEKAEHNLGGLLNAFGGNQPQTYNAIQEAAQNYVSKHSITGVVNAANEITVNVSGYSVTARGIVIDGVFKMGTTFIK